MLCMPKEALLGLYERWTYGSALRSAAAAAATVKLKAYTLHFAVKYHRSAELAPVEFSRTLSERSCFRVDKNALKLLSYKLSQNQYKVFS